MKHQSAAGWVSLLVFFLAAQTGPAAALGVARSEERPAVPQFACQLLSDTGRYPFGIAAGDWNGDGRLDLAVGYTTGGTLSVFLSTAPRSYRALPEIEVGDILRGIGVGDIDGDGDLDLAVASTGTNQTVLLENDGAGRFTIMRKVYSGFAPFTAALAALDGSGKPNLVVVNESNYLGSKVPGTVAVYHDPRSVGTVPLLLQAGQFPSDLQIVDLDGKNGPDLVVSNWGGGTVSVFLNNGDGTFAAAKEIEYGGALGYSLHAADFNRDGKVDLAVTDVERSSVWILDGDGTGRFAPRRQLRAGGGVRYVSAGDIDGDGRVDLVTANTAVGTVSILLGKPGGEFADAIEVPVGPQPRMVLARDLDGDGRLDLAVTLAAANEVALLFQTYGDPVPCPPVLDRYRGGHESDDPLPAMEVPEAAADPESKD